MKLPKSFTTVTPFSKLLAMILFVLFPLFSFYYGMQYGISITKSSSINRPSDTPITSPMSENTCSDEAKLCHDGSFVFRQEPNCVFAACPAEKKQSGSVSADTIKKATTKVDQITLQVSQKTGIEKEDLSLTFKNNDDSYSGGTYGNSNGGGGWWIAAKVNGIWKVTTVGTGSPLCREVEPYYYPKTLVPACKTDKGTIIAR